MNIILPADIIYRQWGGFLFQLGIALGRTRELPSILSTLEDPNSITSHHMLTFNYNYPVHLKSFHLYICLGLLLALIAPPAGGQAAPDLAPDVTAFDLIIAMNTLRVSNGLPALIEHPIINAVAQSTAATMAASQMSWHIGNVSGRIAAAGYGGGARVLATENFAVGSRHTIDTIMIAWDDPDHMLPVTNPAYCHVGAGIAKAPNGMTYYVLQAAYVSGQACGPYTPPSGATPQPGATGSPGSPSSPGVSQIIIPVKIAAPDADGKVFHVVEAGQSFWAIAVAYKITILDLETWNNLSRETPLKVGQRLFIPGGNTEGYFTPTPVGMVLVSDPDSDGKVVHVVQTHQTLSTIAKAYRVDIQTILNLNGIQEDWPLRIDQKLLIRPSSVTPTPTPRPLTPLEKLTPENDGKYYHIVRSGETLSWIAGLYEIQVVELMNWNGLNETSILYPDNKLLLEVTPPATQTHTPGPPTDTPTVTLVPPTPTVTLSPTTAAASPTTQVEPPSPAFNTELSWLIIIGLLAGGGFLVVLFVRRRGA
jgi:LysM repeat protein